MVQHEDWVERRPGHMKHIAVVTTNPDMDPAMDSLDTLILAAIGSSHVTKLRKVVIVGEEIVERITQLRAILVQNAGDLAFLGLSICRLGWRVSQGRGINRELRSSLCHVSCYDDKDSAFGLITES